MKSESTEIKVSVLVFSFNQEEYIADSLNSVLNQKVNFNYEIIIADDGSTDSTMAIISAFKQKFPKKFILLESKKKGVLNNVIRVSSVIRGKYVALLDGDDYWTNENKLQIQTDLLDNHSEYSAVFHDAEIHHIGGAEKLLFHSKKSYSQVYNYQLELFPADIINRTILPTASTLFRKSALNTLDIQLIKDSFSIDWKLFCLIIKNSKFYYINEMWSVYQNHTKGISKNKNEDFHFSHIRFLKKLLKDSFYKKYKYDIYKAISNEYSIILNTKKNHSSKKIFWKYLIAELNKIRFYNNALHEIKKNNL